MLFMLPPCPTSDRPNVLDSKLILAGGFSPVSPGHDHITWVTQQQDRQARLCSLSLVTERPAAFVHQTRDLWTSDPLLAALSAHALESPANCSAMTSGMCDQLDLCSGKEKIQRKTMEQQQ
mmetsp:Transcript_76954/g.184346  ORF Transcript_76954/g.184346 Transcript_76954/m.184346 type:complete len:121 (-) Transcript_76954:95-457(-)